MATGREQPAAANRNLNDAVSMRACKSVGTWIRAMLQKERQLIIEENTDEEGSGGEEKLSQGLHTVHFADDDQQSSSYEELVFKSKLKQVSEKVKPNDRTKPLKIEGYLLDTYGRKNGQEGKPTSNYLPPRKLCYMRSMAPTILTKFVGDESATLITTGGGRALELQAYLKRTSNSNGNFIRVHICHHGSFHQRGKGNQKEPIVHRQREVFRLGTKPSILPDLHPTVLEMPLDGLRYR